MAQLNSLLVTGNSRFLNPINGNARNGIYYVKGTQTAATGAWTGAIPVPALYDGLTIMYYLPYNGSGNATLNLTLSDGTTTGAKNCYYSASRLSTQYGAGQNVVMTYHPAGFISVSGTTTSDDRWVVTADNNSDSTKVAKVGDTITGSINRESGGSWILARDNCVVKQTKQTQGTGSSWNPVVGIKTWAGHWSFGTVGGESLCLSYDTDSDYSTNTNNSKVLYFPSAGSDGTLALTSQIPTNNNQLTNGAGYITSSGSCAYATSAGSASPTSGSTYYIQNCTNSSRSTATSGSWIAMLNSSETGNPTLPTSSKWWTVLSADCWNSAPWNWMSQLAIATQDTNGVWWRRNDSADASIDSSTWHRLAEGDSDGNAVNANKVNNLTVQTAVPANAKFTDTTYPLSTKTIDANYKTAFRTETKGNTASGDYISTIRNDTANIDGSPQYGSGIASGRGDTHMYLYTNYNSDGFYVGGGNADKLNWVSRVYTNNNKPTKSDVGLGNVDNTADANKSVNYATTAGNANKVNNLTVQTAVPANAEFTDTKVTQESFYSYDTGKRNLLTTKEGASSSTNTDTCLKAMDIYCEDGDLVVCDEYEHETHIKGGYIETGGLLCSGTSGMIIANSVTCDSMSVKDISTQYTFHKTSGPWTVQEIRAVRSGNVVTMQLVIKGGSAVSAGSNGIVGTLSGGPLPAKVNGGTQDILAYGACFYGVSALVGILSSSGEFTLRLLINNQSLGSTTTSIGFTFVCD